MQRRLPFMKIVSNGKSQLTHMHTNTHISVVILIFPIPNMSVGFCNYARPTAFFDARVNVAIIPSHLSVIMTIFYRH